MADNNHPANVKSEQQQASSSAAAANGIVNKTKSNNKNDGSKLQSTKFKNDDNNGKEDVDAPKPELLFGCAPQKFWASSIIVYEVLSIIVFSCYLFNSLMSNEIGMIVRYGAYGILAFIGLIFLIIGLITEKQQFFIPYFIYRVLAILGMLAFSIWRIYVFATLTDKETREIYTQHLNTNYDEHTYQTYISFYVPVNIILIIFEYLIELGFNLWFIFCVYECYVYFRNLHPTITNQKQQQQSANVV